MIDLFGLFTVTLSAVPLLMTLYMDRNKFVFGYSRTTIQRFLAAVLSIMCLMNTAFLHSIGSNFAAVLWIFSSFIWLMNHRMYSKLL